MLRPLQLGQQLLQRALSGLPAATCCSPSGPSWLALQLSDHVWQLGTVKLHSVSETGARAGDSSNARAFSTAALPRGQQQPAHAAASSTTAAAWRNSNPAHQRPQQQQQQQQGAHILDGRATAAAWIAELQQHVKLIAPLLGRPPGLAVVLVGSRPDSQLYVSRKAEACALAGVTCNIIRLPTSISQQGLQQAVAAACANPRHDGVLVQLPLPPGLDEEGVMEHLDPRKDVDGFHPLNMGRMLMRGRTSRFVPATPLGVVELLSRSGLSLQGLSAVVVGDSNIVGTPLGGLLRDQGAATVTICHRVSYQEWFEDQQQQSSRAEAEACLPRLPGPQPMFPASAAAPAAARLTSQQQARGAAQGGSCGVAGGGAAAAAAASAARSSGSSSSSSSRFAREQLPLITRTADLLVVAVGHAELVRREWVKPGAIVIDVGINVMPATAAGSGSAAQEEEQQGHHHQQQQQHQDGNGVGPLPPQHGAFAASSSSGGGGGQASRYAVNQGSSSGGNPWETGYRVVGDVAFAEVAQVAQALTPVPGGVGPMTIAAVLHNTLQAASYNAGILVW